MPPPPKPFESAPNTAEAPVPKSKLIKPPPAKTEQPFPDANPGEKHDPDAKQKTVLLYTAPRHGVFYAASYLAGGFFILGAYTYSEMVLKDNPDGTRQPW